MTPLDLYLRSYPLVVMQPKSMGYLMNIDSGGPPAPPYTGPPAARLLRLLSLLQSTDPRQRKRGMRLTKKEIGV